MNEEAKAIKEVLTNHNHHVDELMSVFDMETLELMYDACVSLNAKMTVDMQLVDSVYEKAKIKDELVILEKNMRVLESAIYFKSENFEFCLN